jgi:hypothetical protein
MNEFFFKAINVNELAQQERRRALDSLIFLVEKSNGRIKARMCVNGSIQKGEILTKKGSQIHCINRSHFNSSSN